MDGGDDGGSSSGSESAGYDCDEGLAAATHDRGYESASSSGSDGESPDLMQLSPDEYIGAVGAVAMIDSAYGIVQDAQPYASELVVVLARALEDWRVPDGGFQADQQSASSDITTLLESPTTPSDIMAGLDPEALFVLGVERALVEGVQELVTERPFYDEAPHFLANQLRIRTAHLEVPLEAHDEEAIESHLISLEQAPEPEPMQAGGDPLAALRCERLDPTHHDCVIRFTRIAVRARGILCATETVGRRSSLKMAW
eukprot:COSAG02_NODE_2825_length_7945_cov_79.964440_7_plen_257_part_00